MARSSACCAAPAALGAPGVPARRERPVIDVLVARGAGGRADRARVPRRHAARPARGRGGPPRHRARRAGRRPASTSFTSRGAEALEAVARGPAARAPDPRRNVSAVPLPVGRAYDAEPLEACEVRDEPAASRSRRTREALWRGLGRGDLDIVGTDHCPFRWPTRREARGLLDASPTERRASNPHAAGLRRPCDAGRLSLERFVEVTADGAGADLRPRAAEGHGRAGCRRRPRRLRSRRAATIRERRLPPHARGLHSVRGMVLRGRHRHW